jgi:hypothetical protein
MSSNFNFDKGWNRIEKILFSFGIIFIAVFIYFLSADGIDGIVLHDLLVVICSFIPYASAKCLKWIIDGFRSKNE